GPTHPLSPVGELPRELYVTAVVQRRAPVRDGHRVEAVVLEPGVARAGERAVDAVAVLLDQPLVDVDGQRGHVSLTSSGSSSWASARTNACSRCASAAVRSAGRRSSAHMCGRTWNG